MDGGGGSEAPAIALLMKDPVPTATLKATLASSSTSRPSASPIPTDAPTDIPIETASPVPSITPPPLTAAAASNYCDNLSIFGMKVDDRDDVEANIRNSGTKDVDLIQTVFEWPDVPAPAYLDWFEFKVEGRDRRYYHPHDSDSPTIWSGNHGPLRGGETRRWETDFDDVPSGKIYGSFFVKLTFDVPDQDAHCVVSGSTFKAQPLPTPTPTSSPIDTPVPTNTHTPTSTNTLEPTEITPEPTQTATVTPITPEPTAPSS
jgi:hypothetical protein